MKLRISRQTPAFLLGSFVALLLTGSDSVLLLRTERRDRLEAAQMVLDSQAALLVERLVGGIDDWFDLLRMVGALAIRTPGREAGVATPGREAGVATPGREAGVATPGGEAGLAKSEILREALDELVMGAPALLWLGLLDARGGILGVSGQLPASSDPGILARLAVRTNRPVMAGPRPGPHGPVLDLAVPMRDHVLMAEIALGWAEALRAAEERRGLAGLSLMLLDPQGELLLPPNPTLPPLDALSASRTIASSHVSVQATVRRDLVLAPLRPFAWRLFAGAVAVAVAIGALLAALAHRVERSMAQNRHRAEHDPLTGLLNRAGLRALPGQAGRMVAVAIDLDGFKPINDRHGHGVGDEVLQGVATTMRAHIRPGDAAVRLGGDEFLLLLRPRSREDAAEAAEAVAWRLIRTLAEGIETSAGTLPIGLSAGYALLPEDAESLAAAMKLADAALYAAKAAGKRSVRRAERPPARLAGYPEPLHAGA